MPVPGPGGGGGGGREHVGFANGAGVGGGGRDGVGDALGAGGRGQGGGGRRRPAARERQGNEEIRKFLNFYKRRNSLCVDLYLPAFFQRKPSYDDLAEFVYSVLSEGGTSPPHVIRSAVLDIQLHPVKKLLFIKFTDQLVRDEIVGRLQAGLNWTAFDTVVTGWSMDKPMERVRVLGTSPETDVTEVRSVLGQYGEIVEAQKGLISRKLPGCTNGIWTVKMFLKEGKSLPPFLIMKDEGEVWQLATGEASVCWKCGGTGHIGDKCRQAVNILAESLASPAVGVQPSWAHVVKGGVSLVVTPPPPPGRQQAQQLVFFKLSGGTLRAGKASLKAVQSPVVKCLDPVGRVLDGAADIVEPLETIEDASMVVQLSAVELLDLPSTSSTPKKKVKLSSDIPRDPRLRVNRDPVSLSSSPDLHHKVPSVGRDERHGASSVGEVLHGADSEGAVVGDTGEGKGVEVGAGGSGDVEEGIK